MANQDDWVESSAKRGIKTGALEFYKSRSVLVALVRRELKSRYRGSILGFLWVLGKPIMTLLVFTLIIGEVLGASRSIEYFALYLFISFMFWGFFSEAISVGTHSIVGAEGLIQKISFPREILPVTAIVIAWINMIIQLPVLLVGYAVFQKWPDYRDLLMLIPVLGILIFATTGLALLLSAVTVYVRDVKPLTDLFLMLLMYSVPVIYSWTFVKEKILEHFGNLNLFDIYISNPLATVIISVQDILWPGQRKYSDGSIAPDLFQINSPLIWLMLAVSIAFLILCYKIFLKLEPDFAREL